MTGFTVDPNSVAGQMGIDASTLNQAADMGLGRGAGYSGSFVDTAPSYSSVTGGDWTSNLGSYASTAAPYLKAAMGIIGLLAASNSGQSQRGMMHKMLAPNVENVRAQQNYLASLGIGAPAGQGGPPINAAMYAEGGPIKLSANIGGTPITAEIPAHHLSELKEAGLGALRSFANGGLANATPTPQQGLYPQALIPQAYPKPGATPYRQEVVEGMARGGLLRGPGDGMSDDIPATIEGKEPARVADGEFVIPKEIVHMMDLGQPGHGAAVLDMMVREVRKRAHGHTQQINQGAGRLAAKKIIDRAMKGGMVA